MDTFKKAFMALALTAGIGSAVAMNLPKTANMLDPRYDWEHYLKSPNQPSGLTLQDKTVEEAQTAFGCTGLQEICAEGERVSGTGPNNETINYN